MSGTFGRHLSNVITRNLRVLNAHKNILKGVINSNIIFENANRTSFCVIILKMLLYTVYCYCMTNEIFNYHIS